MKASFLSLSGILCALAAGTWTFAGPVVVVNKATSAEKIDAATLKAIFLGKKVSWDTGGRITLATLKTGPLAEEFFKARLDMTPSAFSNHWRRLAMTGGGIAPKGFDSEADLLKFVAETPGAVGFVAAASDQVAALEVP